MSETVHKGWLTTRDNEKFAPATIVENVFTRSGMPYDTHVRKYISQLKENIDTSIADINFTLSNQDEDIELLKQQDDIFENKIINFNDDNSDTLYIIDQNNYVIAKINSNGLQTTDIFTKGFKYDPLIGKYIVTTASEADNNSINNRIVEILNNITSLKTIDADHNSRINELKSKIENVSNVMDFIGAFDNEIELTNYLNPNHGDVAVVNSTGKEFVYVNDKGWVEFGYSTATATAIADLQEKSMFFNTQDSININLEEESVNYVV